LRQINLARDKREKVCQEIAAAGDAQSLFATERDRRDVAVRVLEINILKCAPTHATIDAERSQIGRGGVSVYDTKSETAGEADVS
jgi:hypothetical protein